MSSPHTEQGDAGVFVVLPRVGGAWLCGRCVIRHRVADSSCPLTKRVAVI